jgi:RimJ/RimL family protein N-acetyltransferase
MYEQDQKFLDALKSPIVTWGPEQVKIINLDIPLSEFSFNYDLESGAATATTPRFTLHSVTMDDYEFLYSLYSNPEVMAQYAGGTVNTPEYTTDRLKALGARWTTGNPYSAMIAQRKSDNSPVGMYNFGFATDVEGNIKPGVTEFAAVSEQNAWNQGAATELMLLLYVVCKYFNDNDLEIAGAKLTSVTTAARHDNVGANKVLQKTGFTWLYNADQYGAPREFYEEPVANMVELLANTEAASKPRPAL